MAGVRLIDLNPNIGTDSDSENWMQTHRDVVNRYVIRASTSSPATDDMYPFDGYLFLPPAYNGKVLFSQVCLSTRGRGTPASGPMSFPRGAS